MKAAEPTSLDRRRLLTVAVLCVSGSVVPPALVPACGIDCVAGSWGGLFPDLRAAITFGSQYLQQHQDEASASWLAKRLFEREWPPDGDEPSTGALVERISRGRQQDFCDGDVLVIDGWFFARTEARLLALLSMTTA